MTNFDRPAAAIASPSADDDAGGCETCCESFRVGRSRAFLVASFASLPLWAVSLILDSGGVGEGFALVAIVGCVWLVFDFVRDTDCTTVGPDGLTRCDALRDESWLDWDDITAATRTPDRSLPTLRLSGPDEHMEIILPLDHENESRLRTLIRRHAPPGHPLVEALDEVEFTTRPLADRLLGEANTSPRPR